MRGAVTLSDLARDLVCTKSAAHDTVTDLLGALGVTSKPAAVAWGTRAHADEDVDPTPAPPHSRQPERDPGGGSDGSDGSAS